MKDFTVAQARRWIEQEVDKHTTRQSRLTRIKLIDNYLSMVASMPDLPTMPRAVEAQRALRAVLGALNT
tara:strand:- start:248 stop:454 length:207 start_codon:yes stop_codon:yes gene_type:complete